MKYIYSFLLLIILNQSIFSQTTISLIDNNVRASTFPLSQFATSILNIPLETTDECLLSEAINVSYTGKGFIVQDIKSNSFYRFDKTGKFLNKIGRQGQGPTEYNKPFSFKVDNVKDHIYILDTYSKRILQYNLNGDFINKIELRHPTNGMIFMSEYILYYNIYNYRKNADELVLINKNGKEQKKIKNNYTDNIQGTILELPQLYTHNNTIFFRSQIDNIVYEVNNDLKKIPIWIINVGKTNFDNKGNKGITIINIKETNNYLFLTYYQKEWKSAVYNKNNKKLDFIANIDETPAFIDDLSYGPPFSIKYSTFSPNELMDNTLISILHADNIDIDEYKNSLFYKSVLNNFKFDGNPIIRIVTLKQ